MTSITLNSPNYASDWLKGESHSGEFFSRDQIVLAAGNGVLTTGTVLGMQTVGAASAAVKASGANTGNGTLTLDLTTPILGNVKPGLYTVRFTSATAFTVNDATGAELGNGVAGSAFADRVKFNTTAGSTPFVAGDGFDVTIAAGSGKYVPATAAATDGSQVACAILFDQSIDTTEADQPAIAITRMATVSHAGLVWGSTINSAALRAAAVAQLKAVGIIDRQAA